MIKCTGEVGWTDKISFHPTCKMADLIRGLPVLPKSLVAEDRGNSWSIILDSANKK